MKKIYEEPIVKVTELPNDVVLTSVNGTNDGNNDVDFGNLLGN